MTKEKVAWYLIAGQEITNIELTDNGSNGYKCKWWKKIPDSPELGTIKHKHPVDGNHQHQDAYTDKPYYPREE